MENAAKGLIVAGGILLAIMTLTMLVYGLTTTSRINEAQDEVKAAQELTNFNAQFEAYNKKRMRGVDVITVINKAAQNNETMNSRDKGERYFVNVIVYTRQSFQNELSLVVLNKDTNETRTYNNLSRDDLLNIPKFNEMRNRLTGNVSIESGRYYELIGDDFYNDTARFNNDFKQRFLDYDAVDLKVEDETTTEKRTYVLQSALTNFKKAIFTCPGKFGDDDNPRYNDEGRIDQIVFIQAQ